MSESVLDQLRRDRAAEAPWCFADGSAPVAAPVLGEVLLVSLGGSGEGILWKLVRGETHDPIAGWVCFVGQAKEALAVVGRSVTRGLPWIEDADALAPGGSWSACFVASEPDGPLHSTLDGASFGLAFLLARASLVLKQPVPVDVCALAAIDGSGAVGPVDGLERKLATIARKAPQVHRVLVASANAERASAIVQAMGARLSVVAVSTAEQAFQAVFRDPGLPPQDAAARSAASLYEAVRSGALQIMDWTSVERTALRLMPALEGDEAARWFAQQVLSIARGHLGTLEPHEALSWPEARPVGKLRSQEVEYLALLVQSRNDSGSKDLPAVVERARQRLEPLDNQHPADCKLRGAIGRALASLRRYGEARELLEQAVKGWCLLKLLPDSSHSLCELLRVCAVLKDGQSLSALEPLADEVVQRVQFAGYLRLARGLAAVLVGRPEVALQHLGESARWGEQHDHVQWSRLRWLARALAARSDREGAAKVRESLRALAPDGVEAALAAVDEALEHGLDARPAAERVLAREPWLRTVWEPLRDDPHWPAQLADEYPY